MLRKIFNLLRVVQWAKNSLVFVPLLASHSWNDGERVLSAFLAFFATCSCASFGYIINDSFDRKSDALHPKKRLRPIASGEISLEFARMVATALLSFAIISIYFLPHQVGLILASYLSISIYYSMRLKRALLLDLFCLATLFTLRIVIGGTAIAVHLSLWLLSFSCFFFWSLASQKRVAEIIVSESHSASGRAYKKGDEFILSVAGVASAASAILILLLYISSQAPELYSRPQFLYGLCLVIGYWIIRSWILVFRKALDDDPIPFFITDMATLNCVVLSILLFWLAL